MRRASSAIWLLAAVSAAVVLLPRAPARAADLAQLYARAIAADDHTSYSGTLTSVAYDSDHAVSTVARVDHQAPYSWRIWYMAPADAYGRLILSDEQRTYQYEPSMNRVISHDWSASAPGVAEPVDIATVLRNYSLQLGPVSSIAGRSAHSLSLISRHTGNLGQRIWIDDKTKLILRRENYNSDGAVTEQTSFDSIRLGVSFPSGLFALTVPKGMTLVPGFDYGKSSQDTADVLRSASFKFAEPKYLPDGFSLMSGSVATHDGVQTVQLVYGDGLRTFSLFENATARMPDFEETTPKPLTVGSASAEFANVAGQTLVSWNAGGLNLTLVGDLSEKESATIGASIHP